MGSVYQRGKKYWIQYYRNGKSYRESSGSEKESDAKRLLKLREGEIAQGKMPGVVYDKVVFDELAADLLLDYRVNARKSMERVEISVNKHLLGFFGGLRAPDVSTSLVQKYIASRQTEGAANGTINRELAALKRAFTLGYRCTPPKVAQVPFIPMLAENNTRKGFFEHEQFVALLKELPQYLRGLVTFAYKTGWRRGEIIGLTWGRVDLARGVVRLEAGETKNGQGRTVFLDEELKLVMKDQFTSRNLGCPNVFHRDGKPIKDFRGAWETATARAHLEGKLFHDLRRTAVRNMVRAGIPERVAMQISGHKTRTVFDRYNIVSESDLQEAAARLQTYLPSGHNLGTMSKNAPSKDAGASKVTLLNN